jgi:hypothetical protein
MERVGMGSAAGKMPALNRWKRVNEIPGFPFDAFDELQVAVRAKSFNLGVDPLAAAEWTERSGGRPGRTVVAALSVLLLIAGVVSIVAAIATRNYWLLLALPIQALTFYFSQPASPYRRLVTIAGALSIIVFLNLLLNKWVTPATLVAYAGLTFAAVRSAGFVTSAAFRKAMLADEGVFLAAYEQGECSLRNNRTEKEYRS